MSYTNGLDKPTDYFETKLYTGTGSSQSITGVGFQPDWVWIKKRSGVDGARMFDVVRGASEGLFTNSNAEEVTVSSEHTSFDSDGFSLGSSENVNESSGTFVSWNWLAGGTASSNTDGSITSQVSANTTSGFSIVSYTGNATSGATVGHGLGAVPKMIIVKKLNGAANWTIYNSNLSTGASSYLYLNSTDAEGTNYAGYWNSTTPTSSVFTLGNAGDTNGNTNTYIAYCFAEKKGFSRFGSFQGNGSNDGSYIHLGFKPAFLIIRRTDDGDNWVMFDNKRNEFNLTDKRLYSNSNVAEATASSVSLDLLSNGFKLRGTDSQINNASGSYIYMCFSESPFTTSTGIPTTAR
ncbi:hypothetical protein N8637_01105 [Verrucomicrobia bacterium]|nr:hypothetical protein [Verrucomicrobiota bacterium]